MKIILSALLLISMLTASSQFTVYKTYSNFKDSIGENYASFEGTMHVMGKISLYLKKGGKEYKVKCSDMWGFKFKGSLFRIQKKYSMPVLLVSEGKICYYENGLAHLDMVDSDENSGSYDMGFCCYLSNKINSPIVQVKALAFKEFKKKYPAHKKFYECVGKDYKEQDLRDCIKSYQGKEDKVIVFKTYSDFENKKAEIYSSYKRAKCGAGSCKYFFKKGNTSVELKSDEIWGFIYKNMLVRTSKNGYPLLLISNDRIMFYRNLTKFESGFGYIFYVSEKLGDIPIPMKKGSAFGDFIEKFDGGKSFVECTNKKYLKEYIVNNCMKDFQEIE